MMAAERYGLEPILDPEEDLASAFDYMMGGRSREEKRRFYDAITRILEEVYPYHILSIHRFIYPLQSSTADINACTIDQGLGEKERMMNHENRVKSAYQKLAELENQILKGEFYDGN